MSKFFRTGIIVVVLALLVSLIPMGTAEASWTYTVQPNDSIWRIAQRYGTTVNGIKQASNYWSDMIRPGQRLVIPSGTQATGNYYASSNHISQSDVELIARLVEAEAQGEPYNGKVGVAAVVLNRVESSEFPNTVAGVIYERHAFESVTNNLIWRRSPSNQAYNAARDAQNGWDPTYGSVFFWNPYKPVTPWIWSRPIVTQYGNHVFAA